MNAKFVAKKMRKIARIVKIGCGEHHELSAARFTAAVNAMADKATGEHERAAILEIASEHPMFAPGEEFQRIHRPYANVEFF